MLVSVLVFHSELIQSGVIRLQVKTEAGRALRFLLFLFDFIRIKSALKYYASDDYSHLYGHFSEF